MGTRHLINVVYDGKLVISQYGQWDGYPTGQGVDVCNFIRSGDYTRLKVKAERGELKFLSHKDAETLNKILFPHHQEKKKGKAKTVELPDAVKDSLRTILDESHFSRDRGAEILKMAARALFEFYTIDSSDFEEGGIFRCEYVHLLNLDKDTYTIYVPSTTKSRTYRVSTIQKWGDRKVYNEMDRLEKGWRNKEE